MIKLSMSWVALAMVSFGLAQNPHANFEQSNPGNGGTLASNSHYLEEVLDELTPNPIRFLETVVSDWEVTSSDEFNPHRRRPFSATFQSRHGFIVVSYDRKGRIVHAMERFSNFALPKSVGKAILKEYPNWKIIGNRYSLWYRQDDSAKRIFKVRLQKEHHKKWVKVFPSGRVS